MAEINKSVQGNYPPVRNQFTFYCVDCGKKYKIYEDDDNNIQVKDLQSQKILDCKQISDPEDDGIRTDIYFCDCKYPLLTTSYFDNTIMDYITINGYVPFIFNKK